MKKIWIDTETTGLDPQAHDICQLAGIIEVDGKELREFDYKIRPLNFDSISEDALAVNGLTIEQLKAFPDAKDVLVEFIALLSGYVDSYDKQDKFTMYGYNVRFDADMLRAWMQKCGYKYFGSYFWWPAVDVAQNAHVKLMQAGQRLTMPNFKLATVAETLGITPDGALHDAMTDIRLTREIQLKIEGM